MSDESEVILGIAGDESEFSCYSTRPNWWKKCEAVGGKLVKSGGREGKDAWREYAVPLNCVKLRKPKKVSEAQRQAARERFAKARAGKA